MREIENLTKVHASEELRDLHESHVTTWVDEC